MLIELRLNLSPVCETRAIYNKFPALTTKKTLPKFCTFKPVKIYLQNRNHTKY